MKILLTKTIGLVLLATVFSYFTYIYFGQVYIKMFDPSDSWIGAEITIIMGLPAAYLFFLFFTIPLFIRKANKWFYIIVSIPVVLFEIFFDPFHFYFPFIFGLIGLMIGTVLAKFIFPTKVRPEIRD